MMVQIYKKTSTFAWKLVVILHFGDTIWRF